MKHSIPLSPARMYPADVRDVTTRMVALSSGIQVRIAESGPRDGLPVVMLHGWGASLYTYRHALALLPALRVRAIAVDLRGFGLSEKPRHRGAYTLDAYCADLDALLDALELARVALIGHSMGGGLALHYALRRSERLSRLFLFNPTGLVPVVYPVLLRAVPSVIVRVLRERFVPRALIGLILRHLAFGNVSCVTERDVDEYWAPTQQPGYVHAAYTVLREFDWRPLTAAGAASLPVPNVVVLGARDRVIRNAYAAATGLHAARVEVFDGGHCVHEEFPKEVYGLVGELIR